MYKGQEKVKILTGDYKGSYGYVRLVSPFGWLIVAVNGGHPRISILDAENELEYIHSNYFLSGTEEYMKGSPLF